MKTAKNCNQLQRVKKKFAFLLNCKSFFSVTAVTTDCCSRSKNNPTTQKTKKKKKTLWNRNPKPETHSRHASKWKIAIILNLAIKSLRLVCCDAIKSVPNRSSVTNIHL